MHGKVSVPFLHRHFKLLDEQSLATDLRQRSIENLVAARRHAEDIDDGVRIQCCQSCLDVLRLPHRQTRFARGDGDP